MVKKDTKITIEGINIKDLDREDWELYLDQCEIIGKFCDLTKKKIIKKSLEIVDDILICSCPLGSSNQKCDKCKINQKFKLI